MMRDDELVARLTCDILKRCHIVHVVDGSHIENALSIPAKHGTQLSFRYRFP